MVPHSQSGGKGAEDEQKQDWKFGRNEGPMTWPWKLLCAILYMLPWVDVAEKSVYLVERFPAFVWTEYFTGGADRGTYTHAVHTCACMQACGPAACSGRTRC